RIPQPNAAPFWIVKRPPARANPVLFLEDGQSPATADHVVARNDVGRPQLQGAELRDIVEIADPGSFRELIMRDGWYATRHIRTAAQDRRRPFGKASERLRDGPRVRGAQVKSGVEGRIVESTAALRRNVKATSWLVFSRGPEPWKNTMQRQA